MSKPADKPEVVQLSAEPPMAVPVNSRRVAAQRVREARDRLTSTSGTRPAFDRELLRQYAQTRISASYVVMLLVVSAGVLFGLWMQPLSAMVWTCGVLCIHAAIIRTCVRFLAEQPKLSETRKWRTRFVLLDLIYGLCWMSILIHPAARRGFRHRDDVPDAAGDRGVEHARRQPADRGACARPLPVTVAIALNFVLSGSVRRLRARRAGAGRGGLFCAARLPAAFDDAGDAGSARREGRADRRTRTGEIDLRRGAPPRGSRQHREVALSRADEPRAAHAAQRHPRLFRGDEERDFRRPCGAGLQGIFGRHPQFRRPPAQPDQRDPRSVADRGRALRAQRGSGVAGACGRPTAIIC